MKQFQYKLSTEKYGELTLIVEIDDKVLATRIIENLFMMETSNYSGEWFNKGLTASLDAYSKARVKAIDKLSKA
jgi:alpha-mannosidase